MHERDGQLIPQTFNMPYCLPGIFGGAATLEAGCCIQHGRAMYSHVKLSIVGPASRWGRGEAGKSYDFQGSATVASLQHPGIRHSRPLANEICAIPRCTQEFGGGSVSLRGTTTALHTQVGPSYCRIACPPIVGATTNWLNASSHGAGPLRPRPRWKRRQLVGCRPFGCPPANSGASLSGTHFNLP